MKKTFSIVAALMLAVTSSAFADTTIAATRSWSFQTIVPNGGSMPNNFALAMRDGQAWPVVLGYFFDDNPDYSIQARTLMPAINPVNGTSWFTLKSFPDIDETNVRWIRAESSPDGRVAFLAPLWSTSSSSTAAGYITTSNGQWNALASDIRAIAFGSNGSFYSATNTAVNGANLLPTHNGSVMAMSVSKYNDIGILTSNYEFLYYSHLTSSWQTTAQIAYAWSDITDLTFDSKGRPHVLSYWNDQVIAFDYNIKTGQWDQTILSTGIGQPAAPVLAANDSGEIGTTLKTADGLVFYYKDDDNEWKSELITTGLIPGNVMGETLAYDYNGLPVVAYIDSGKVMLAYDPISM